MAVDSEALSIVKGRLIAASPWLALAFGRLIGQERRGLSAPGTDGVHFFYDPEWLHADLASGSAALAHCVAHCLLGHLQQRAPDNVAADMAATLLLDGLLPDLCTARGSELFLQARHRLAGVPLNGIAAAMAGDDFFFDQRAALMDLLTVDDHGLWHPEGTAPRGGEGNSDGWQELRNLVSGANRGGRIGRYPGNEMRRYNPGRVPARNYRALLSRYAEYREEPREDMDAFDRDLYAYGLAQYGNLPLVEYPETREARHIDELAIVIDTSASCLETLTDRFLDETRALLADETLFSRRFNLRLLQCDAQVRRDDVITCVRDFERYIASLRLVGGGGTDFRPAFARLDRLIERGAFRRLGAAVFFSDGMGLFPPKPPDYDAIFVFFRGMYDDIDVPGWVHRLVLEVGA